MDLHNWDICTSARPEETEACFNSHRIVETGLEHSSVTVLEDGEPYEITTCRTEGPTVSAKLAGQMLHKPKLDNKTRERQGCDCGRSRTWSGGGRVLNGLLE